jgi:hypothetical protein
LKNIRPPETKLLFDGSLLDPERLLKNAIKYAAKAHIFISIHHVFCDFRISGFLQISIDSGFRISMYVRFPSKYQHKKDCTIRVSLGPAWKEGWTPLQVAVFQFKFETDFEFLMAM